MREFLERLKSGGGYISFYGYDFGTACWDFRIDSEGRLVALPDCLNEFDGDRQIIRSDGPVRMDGNFLTDGRRLVVEPLEGELEGERLLAARAKHEATVRARGEAEIELRRSWLGE